MIKLNYEKSMKYALKLAQKAWGMTSPNPMVGALVLKNNTIIGEGFHQKAGAPHAEIIALNQAGKKAKGATLVVTLEPCSTFGRTPPCTQAIIKAGIKKVIIGTLDPNPIHAGCAIEILQHASIDVEVGILQKQCEGLNEAFNYFITQKMPFITLKMAMTLDGKIADYQGMSKWITSEIARKRVQVLRQHADAIMVGGGTARADLPSLKINQKGVQQPRRLIATHQMSLDKIRTLVTGEPLAEKFDISTKQKVINQLQILAREGVSAILVEGGGMLADTLLRFGVIQKIEFHIAPTILGGEQSYPVVGGKSHRTLPEALHLKNIKTGKLGTDFFLIGYL